MTSRAYQGIRWGILGPGRIAQTFAAAMSVVDSGTIVAVHSSQIERAQTFAAQFNIPIATDDRDVFFDESAIDAVYIAYPHSMHAETIMAVLEKGKHILCEKPLVTSESEARSVTVLAQQKKLLLMEALWTRFLPAWQRVEELLDNNSIGNIEHLKASFGFFAPFNPNDRLFNPSLAGGAMWDIGIYPIAMSQFVMRSMPTQINAAIVRGDTGVDEDSEVSMIYPNNVRCEFRVSLREALKNEFEIIGSEGSITIHSPFWGAEKITVRTEQENTELHPHDLNGFEYQIRHFNTLINEGYIESPIVSSSDTIAFQRIMDDILAQ